MQEIELYNNVSVVRCISFAIKTEALSEMNMYMSVQGYVLYSTCCRLCSTPCVRHTERTVIICNCIGNVRECNLVVPERTDIVP